MKLAVLFFLSLAPLGTAGSPDYFAPSHRVSGIGVERDDISDLLLKARTDRMIQSQTFVIMRDPRAVPGAKRITRDVKLQAVFKTAAQRSGLPASLVEAVAYLESWGDPKAESPAGPKGVMQISGATARSMGLKVLEAKRYKVTKERVKVKTRRGKPVYKTLKHKTPYTVTVRDDRLYPDRAIPAAAKYLAGMEQKFGGRDWAIFAYHCGQGCVGEMLDLTRRARGIPKDEITVPRMFFSNNPAWNRELYDAIQQQMQRDYSPTYYFRVKRAEQLLALYRGDPEAFLSLAQEYRSDLTTSSRAPHRLSVWLRRDDMVFANGEDIRAAAERSKLVRAFDRPTYFNYLLRISPEGVGSRGYLSLASPSAVGTLAYVAYETRRLFDELKPRGERFQPLPVTSLVEPEDHVRRLHQPEALAHSSGQVFDIEYSALPPEELECLRFVLSDLGWEGYLGFIEEGRDNMHIGCSPTSRDFFTSVFNDAVSSPAAE